MEHVTEEEFQNPEEASWPVLTKCMTFTYQAAVAASNDSENHEGDNSQCSSNYSRTSWWAPNHHDLLSWWSDELLEHPPQRTTGGSLKPVLPLHDEQKAQAKNVWNIRNTYDIYLQKFWNMTIIRKNLKITYAAKFNPNPSIIHASSCQEVCGSMAKMGRSWSKAVWIQLDWA